MRLVATPKPIFKRLQQLSLAVTLAREAGWRHVGSLALCTGISSVLDIAGLGMGVSLLLGSGPIAAVQLPFQLSLRESLIALVLVMLVRGLLQALISISQEQLRTRFADRLRQDLLSQVLYASSYQLEQLSRGDLIGLLMADINRSVLALDKGLLAMQALLSLLLYGIGVVVVGREATMPLLLALVATAVAAVLQRSGSWRLGRLRTRLNAALQRTVGDGLHGLKAIRAATAEGWLMERFMRDNHAFREVHRKQVQRSSIFTALRDTLVVLVVGMWLVLGRGDMSEASVATTLLLAFRSGTALSDVITAQRLCIGSLPGYEELCKRRARLALVPEKQESKVLTSVQLEALEKPGAIKSIEWRSGGRSKLKLSGGTLVAVVGPSGSGKTTLLDGFCGLLGDGESNWQIQSHRDQLTLSGPAGARQLRKLLAYAPQDAVLFEASLRQNLLLDRQQHVERIEEWLERLGLAHLLMRPGGLDDPLSLALDHFSGGEIHRLGLLRAWLRDRPVEVLDEPTAFLDDDSATRVRAILKGRSRERLILVSTHDPELVQQADQVVVLEASDRKIAEQQHHGGNHGPSLARTANKEQQV